MDEQLRERVLADLRDHWHAGRVDADEHERRTVIARHATTQEQLAHALDGLPETGRTGAGMLVLGESASETRGAPEVSGGREVERRDDRTDGLIPMRRSTANSIMGLVPILALILFFTTGSWLWFFAVPIVSIIVFGKGKGKGKGGHGRNNG